MAINLIYTRPEEKVVKENEEIINTEIIPIQDNFSTRSLKDTIYIKYDPKGNYIIQEKDSSGTLIPTTKTSFSLGNKNEHRVTWISFDVEDLLWNKAHILQEHELELSLKELNNIYHLYNFKLVFKTKGDQLYTFFLTKFDEDNRVIFEVPRILTQYSGDNFKMLLMIEENHQSSNNNEYQHNIYDNSGEITSKNLDADLTTREEENSKNEQVDITYATLGYVTWKLNSSLDNSDSIDWQVRFYYADKDNNMFSCNRIFSETIRNEEGQVKQYCIKYTHVTGEEVLVYQSDVEDEENNLGWIKDYYRIITFSNDMNNEFVDWCENNGAIADKLYESEVNWQKITERFVTKEITVSVKNSLYNGEGLQQNNWLIDSNQYDSLTKPTLWGKLTSKGSLSINIKEIEEGNEVLVPTNVLGQELDSYVKYIKFDAQYLTGEVGQLRKYLFFRHTTADGGYQIAYSPLTPIIDNSHNDVWETETEKYDYIAWIPARVYEYPGTWTICLVAFAGRVPVKPTFNEWREEQLSYEFESIKSGSHYYCYISNAINMIVEDSFLTKKQFVESKEWNSGYEWSDDEVDENGDVVLDENGNPVVSDNVTLDKDYVSYNPVYDGLYLNTNLLQSTDMGINVSLRNFNINTTKISFINGCEVVDKEARQMIHNLNSAQESGGQKVIQMGSANFQGTYKSDDYYPFFYRLADNDNQPLWIYESGYLKDRMYSIKLSLNVNPIDEKAAVRLFFDFTYANVEHTKEVILLIPGHTYKKDDMTTWPTIEDLNRNFVKTDSESNTWYFSGHFMQLDNGLTYEEILEKWETIDLYLVTGASAVSEGGSGSGGIDNSTIKELNEKIIDNKEFNDSWQPIIINFQERSESTSGGK